MKRFKLSPLFIIIIVSFILIDGTFYALYAVLCAFLHELGHIIAIKIMGGKVGALKVHGFGIQISGNLELDYKREAISALMGPIASLLAGLVFILLSRLGMYTQLVVFLAMSNLCLFAVNILPIYPLDGGRCLYCILAGRLEQSRASLITKIVSVVFIIPLLIAAVYLVVQTGYNFSLAILCAYLVLLLIVGLFKSCEI